MNESRFRSRLIGLTTGVLLALLIWPATVWLVRSHVRLAVPTAGRVAPWGLLTNVDSEILRAKTYQEIAARHPEDFELQLADAVTQDNGWRLGSFLKVHRLRELANRYPGRPTVHAAILRFSTMAEIRIRRPEDGWPTGNEAKALPPKPDFPQSTPALLSAYDRHAAEGERLDPDNAYFPFMRAVGYFAGDRDAEALSALERASRKSQWSEYYDDEVHARWKMAEKAYGKTGSLSRMAIAYGIVFPHYLALRTASRVAIAKAGEAEKAGRVEEGLEIRESVARCGRLMRIHSSSAIGSLIGIATTRLSMVRPGGAPPIPDPVQTKTRMSAAAYLAQSEPVIGERLRAYEAYLRKTGHTDRIPGLLAEEDAARRTQLTVRPKSDNSLTKLAVLWIASLILVSNALLFLVLGGLSSLLARHRSVRSGVGWVRGAHPTWTLWLLVGTVAICALFLWQLAESTGVFVNLIWSAVASGGESVYQGEQQRALICAVGAILPCLTLLTLGTLSLLWRVPLSVGVTRGMRGLAVPMACVLLLGFAVLAPFVIREESAIEEALRRTVQHEGRYLSELAGKTWPQ
jgi:hypothetical protein